MADTPLKVDVKRLKRHMLPTSVLGLAARPDAKTLYAACMDGVYELNPETGESRALYKHESWASGAVLLEGSNTLVTGGYDGALTWWDLAAGKKIRKVQEH